MNTLMFAGVGLIAVALLGTAYFFAVGRPNPPLVPGQVRIDGATFTVEVASTTLARARGLSFRQSLGQDQGMLFLFSTGAVRSFWMKDMRFPIDIVWISGNSVAGVVQNAAPAPGVALWNLPQYRSPADTDKVLEVNAGTVAQYNIKVGDTVEFDL